MKLGHQSGSSIPDMAPPFSKRQYLSACVPPRTHHANRELVFPVSPMMPETPKGIWKRTSHAWVGRNSARTSVVEDQYAFCRTFWNGCPGGSAGPGVGTDGSTKLANSSII